MLGHLPFHLLPLTSLIRQKIFKREGGAKPFLWTLFKEYAHQLTNIAASPGRVRGPWASARKYTMGRWPQKLSQAMDQTAGTKFLGHMKHCQSFSLSVCVLGRDASVPGWIIGHVISGSLLTTNYPVVVELGG